MFGHSPPVLEIILCKNFCSWVRLMNSFVCYLLSLSHL